MARLQPEEMAQLAGHQQLTFGGVCKRTPRTRQDERLPALMGHTANKLVVTRLTATKECVSGPPL